jgi:ATPase subunit of ABC transporter with duplicated ATPase domains
MRAALAQALFISPGLLLLDEPTNHLDLPATLWLASYLSSPACAKTATLLVTHSADFVASCATDLLHLDHFQKKITTHKGDVWNFLNGADDRFKAQSKAFDAQQKKLAELKSKGGLSAEKAAAKLLKDSRADALLVRAPRASRLDRTLCMPRHQIKHLTNHITPRHHSASPAGEAQRLRGQVFVSVFGGRPAVHRRPRRVVHDPRALRADV